MKVGLMVKDKINVNIIIDESLYEWMKHSQIKGKERGLVWSQLNILEVFNQIIFEHIIIDNEILFDDSKSEEFLSKNKFRSVDGYIYINQIKDEIKVLYSYMFSYSF